MPRKRRTSPKIDFGLLRVLIQLSVLCALGSRKGLQGLFATRPFQRLSKHKTEEALLEIHLFAGFPATIDGFIELRRFTSRASGLRTNSGRDGRQARLIQGKRLCRRIYRDNYDKLMARMSGLHPELARWIVEDGYGKVLSRAGLTLIERETVAIAALGALGWKRQFESHMRGLENLGVQPKILRRILLELGVHVSKRKVRSLVTGTKYEEIA